MLVLVALMLLGLLLPALLAARAPAATGVVPRLAPAAAAPTTLPTLPPPRPSASPERVAPTSVRAVVPTALPAPPPAVARAPAIRPPGLGQVNGPIGAAVQVDLLSLQRLPVPQRGPAAALVSRLTQLLAAYRAPDSAAAAVAAADWDAVAFQAAAGELATLQRTRLSLGDSSGFRLAFVGSGVDASGRLRLETDELWRYDEQGGPSGRCFSERTRQAYTLAWQDNRWLVAGFELLDAPQKTPCQAG